MAAKHNFSYASISVYIFNSKIKTKTKIFAVGIGYVTIFTDITKCIAAGIQVCNCNAVLFLSSNIPSKT